MMLSMMKVLLLIFLSPKANNTYAESNLMLLNFSSQYHHKLYSKLPSGSVNS